MKRLLLAATTAVALALPAAVSAAEPAPADLEAARGLAKRFFESLKGELQAAIQAGGPVNAIEVCRREAPGIAGEISTDSGWAVGRTALKVRNPRNAPSPAERAVLIHFKQRAAAGESLKGMESAAVVEAGGQRYLHYMKAIPTGDVCLACHGDPAQMSEELKTAIRDSYPADAATGFEAGELRGAFTFVKPLD